MNLRPYQTESKDCILDEWTRVDKTLLVLPTGCHDPEQGILMFNGSIKKAKDIHVGELLMGPDSEPRIVLKRHEGESEMVKVTPTKGEPFIVTEDHRLAVRFDNGPIVDEVASNWFEWSDTKKDSCTLFRAGLHSKMYSNYKVSMSYVKPKFNCEKVGRGPFVGFTVDKDSQYLLDDTTVTFNCGKTIVFCKLIEELVQQGVGNRILVLAHRGELLNQAADKLEKSTGLKCAIEKAEDTAKGSWFSITVGSVQTMMRQSRLERFDPNYYSHIIIDEAHHAVSESYQKILNYFSGAKVLGVTATPDRSDMKNLGTLFETKAYEYTLPRAIKDGFLVPIKALTIPLKLDLSGVSTQAGDFKASDLGDALDPFLEQIAEEMKEHCKNRKTVVFLPLIATSQKMQSILESKGFRVAEVNGSSTDRKEILEGFQNGEYDIITNSMLLSEGWDCPSVDCIVCLRPTKSRALYCLDEQTEVLTDNGWRNFSNYQDGDKCAAFNIKNEEIVYLDTKARVHRNLYEDEQFVSIESQSADIRVTGQHTMIYDNKRKLGWKKKTADKLADLKDTNYIPVAGYKKVNGLPLTDDEIKFIGWVMTDGTINKKNNAIQISQGKHQKWLEEIPNCIEACGMKYGRREFWRTGINWNQTSKCVTFTVSKGEPRGSDKHLRGWGYLEDYISKDFNEILMNLSRRQFDVLLETIHLADGAKQENQSWTRQSYHIAKGNKNFIENLQICAIHNGYRANMAVYTKNRENPLYVLHLKKQNWSRIGGHVGDRPSWKKTGRKDGEMCWCVENDLGTLVTRRNGRVAIVGNCQILGRGTRLSPETGKDHLLALDFLWNTERHELCRPAHLIAESDEVAKKITENLEEEAGCAVDLEEAEAQAESDCIEEREASLAKKLAEMRNRKRKLVDPLQFEMSIEAQDLASYEPSFGWEMAPPSEKQKEQLDRFGILPDEIDNSGKASKILDRLNKRRSEGLTTPKQIRCLERYGFKHVGTWQFEQAKPVIDRIAGNGWRIPRDIHPSSYTPKEVKKEPTTFGFGI